MKKLIMVFACITLLAAFNFFPIIASADEIPEEPDYKKVDAFVEKEMKECRIPGFSLAIAKGDKVLYTKGYGIADPSGRSVTTQTPFLTASMSKTFTAMAVMQLVEAGKISLDKPIQTYIPWFKLSGPEASSIITVRQLLNQTSGIGPSAEFGIATVRGDDTTIRQMVGKMSTLSPTAPAGSKFQYNNANFIILGELIESVTGVTYEEYIEQNIFKPLEMNHSYVSMEKAKKDGAAIGYRTIFGFPSVADLPYRTDFIPAVGIITCSEDISKYMLALLNDGIYKNSVLLSKEGLSQMFTPAARISKWESYGLGWYVTSGSYYHGGELTNFQSKLKILSEDSLGVALMYNTSSSMATTLFNVGYRDRIESGIINILYGIDPENVPRGPGLNRYPVGVTYTVYILLCALIILALAYSVSRLGKFRQRMASGRYKIWILIPFTLLIHFIIPALLLFLPGMLHLNWRHILYLVPDIGWFSLSVVLCLLSTGVVKATAIHAALKANKVYEHGHQLS